MRGKHCNGFCGERIFRITPADAGKTPDSYLCLSCKQDHPRGCGENVEDACEQSVALGSPPRMRGKLIDEETGEITDRITPADAGKTLA